MRARPRPQRRELSCGGARYNQLFLLRWIVNPDHNSVDAADDAIEMRRWRLGAGAAHDFALLPEIKGPQMLRDIVDEGELFLSRTIL